MTLIYLLRKKWKKFIIFAIFRAGQRETHSMRSGIYLIPHKVGVWLIVLIGLLWINWTDAYSGTHELPCQYLDSINITDGTSQSDESILFDNITFTKDQYSVLNYMLENGTERVTVKPYLRGCLCNTRPCIRLCCPFGSITDRTMKEKKKCRPHEMATQFASQVEAINDDTKKMLLNHSFRYVDDIPCPNFYASKHFKIAQVCN